MSDTVFVTGGAGFIGSALVRYLITNTNYNVVNIDALTYAGDLSTVSGLDPVRLTFYREMINFPHRMYELMLKHKPIALFNLAAETHVDRSIDRPAEFIQTNILGTFSLLDAAKDYVSHTKLKNFKFVHISTDEVFGELGAQGKFTPTTRYDPRSPYSASKAASDHLVRSWFTTYGFPTIITNCSNNYGPYQFPEKLIPLMILKALNGEKLPVYGRGENIRDWIYVEDHVRGLVDVLEKGVPGETYLFGGDAEWRNIDVVFAITALLDRKTNNLGSPRAELVTFVKDRLGHDQRYAVDFSATTKRLGWVPEETFLTGLEKTVDWYLENLDWCEMIAARSDYRGARLGLGATHETS